MTQDDYNRKNCLPITGPSANPGCSGEDDADIEDDDIDGKLTEYGFEVDDEDIDRLVGILSTEEDFNTDDTGRLEQIVSSDSFLVFTKYFNPNHNSFLPVVHSDCPLFDVVNSGFNHVSCVFNSDLAANVTNEKILSVHQSQASHVTLRAGGSGNSSPRPVSDFGDDVGAAAGEENCVFPAVDCVMDKDPVADVS